MSGVCFVGNGNAVILVNVSVVDDDNVRIEIIEMKTEISRRAEAAFKDLRDFHQIIVMRRNLREIFLYRISQEIEVLGYGTLGIAV